MNEILRNSIRFSFKRTLPSTKVISSLIKNKYLLLISHVMYNMTAVAIRDYKLLLLENHFKILDI